MLTRLRFNRAGIVFLLWTAPVVGSVVSVLRAQGTWSGWPRVLASEAVFWYCWAFVTLGVLALLDRVPFSRRRWLPETLLHVVAAVAVTAAHVGVAVVGSQLTGIASPEPVMSAYVRFLRQFGLVELLLYALVVVVGSIARLTRVSRDHALRASRLEAELGQARLAALTSQLRPHFLFNSLNTVASLVRADDKDDALRVVVGLSALLRRVLRAEPSEVPLREEVDFFRQYLEIEQIRFGDRLTFVIDTPPDTLDVLVPVLILQPLAENAVRHGIASREQGGTVELRARLHGSVLRVEVRDDGCGWGARVNGSHAARGPTGAAPVDGVGLRNTRNRLAQLYGDRAGVALSSADDGGAVVVLEMPARGADVVLDGVHESHQNAHR